MASEEKEGTPALPQEEQEEKTSLSPEEQEKTSLPPEKSDLEKESPTEKKEIEIPSCPVHSVVVYPDRAEVNEAICMRAFAEREILCFIPSVYPMDLPLDLLYHINCR